MIFNVAGLLSGSVGDQIRFHFTDETLDYEDVVFQGVEAKGRLMRTDRTVLALADVRAFSDMWCARCLTPTMTRLELEFAEEFEPSNVDLVVRRRVWRYEDEQEDDALTIDASNVLDMSSSIWQSLRSALPMMPLCSEDCPGLCAMCSANLKIEPCRCGDRPKIETEFAGSPS